MNIGLNRDEKYQDYSQSTFREPIEDEKSSMKYILLNINLHRQPY